MSDSPSPVDLYLAELGPEQRSALARLVKSILAAAPAAEPCISYKLPAFRFEGRVLVAFAAARKHCALYPMSGTLIDNLRDELRDFETSKGTIRFQPDQPLPVPLVRKIVKARIAENRDLSRKRTR